MSGWGLSAQARTAVLGAAMVMGVATVSAMMLAPAVVAQESDQSVRTFMRKKLEPASQILEGLATKDADLIQAGAKALGELSRAEKWQILTDAAYREHNREFRAAVEKVAEAAGKRNFDNAALQWFDAVKSCMECHDHVREVRAKK